MNDEHYEGHAARPYACHDTTELDYHLRGQRFGLWVAGIVWVLAMGEDPAVDAESLSDVADVRSRVMAQRGVRVRAALARGQGGQS